MCDTLPRCRPSTRLRSTPPSPSCPRRSSRTGAWTWPASTASSAGRSRAACGSSRSRATPASSARSRRRGRTAARRPRSTLHAAAAALMVGVGRRPVDAPANRAADRPPPGRTGSWSTSPAAPSGRQRLAAGTTSRSRAPSPGWPSCRMSGTRPSAQLTFERSLRSRAQRGDDQVRRPGSRPASPTSSDEAGPPLLWICGLAELVGAVLPRRRRDRVHVGPGGHRAPPVPRAARAPARRTGGRGARDLAARAAVRGASRAKRWRSERAGGQGGPGAAIRDRADRAAAHLRARAGRAERGGADPLGWDQAIGRAVA